MSTVLQKDTSIPFPHFFVLKASAGSGKTYALSQRFVQFILSDKVPRNNLRNIVAITFSNNAAKEMKERILSWLKTLCFEDEKSLSEISGIVTIGTGLKERAERLISGILADYSDFQVRTIDSYMTTIFKASALDFGLNPEFDILLSSERLMEYSFNLYMRNINETTYDTDIFKDVIEIISANKKGSASFLWDPSQAVLGEVKRIQMMLGATGKKFAAADCYDGISNIKNKLRSIIITINEIMNNSGLIPRSNSSYPSIAEAVREESFIDVIGKGFANPPAVKPCKTDTAGQQAFEKIKALWSEFSELVEQYTLLHAGSFYVPYLKVYEALQELVEEAKRRQGKIFIEDINRKLSEYLDREIVPDVYFRLGETIFHYFIDEFQDTSPLQWKNLLPLIENSLSQGGSLLVVGDTKQAIYGFRHADYAIMKGCETENPFPSAHHTVKELGTNYRSKSRILDFSQKVFKDVVAGNEAYRSIAGKSGLTDYVQNPRDFAGERGYAEVTIHERNDEDPPERFHIQELIKELHGRGYPFSDVAVLTQKNEDAVRVSGWLNEENIPFISFSSLDIRRRKVTGEIISLLRFLDSPPDDLSFSTFILGGLFCGILREHQSEVTTGTLSDFVFLHRDMPPLYKSFQKQFPDLWERYFSGLFKSSGYLPLYDLLSEVFSVFGVFDISREEEAAFAKILDVVKNFEGQGFNSVRDFLSFASEAENTEAEWDMSEPKGIDAVRVMTIHKSKGLGFPVVIVLLYEEWGRKFDYVPVEGENSVRLMKITKEMIVSAPQLADFYDAAYAAERVNSLNTLYVGFTRAQEELYIVGVRTKGGYPLDILPPDDFVPSEKPAVSPKIEPEPAESQVLRHYRKQTVFEISPEELLTAEEKRRGEFIHKVLSRLEYAGEGFEEDLLRIISDVNRETGNAYPEDDTARTVMEIVGHKDVAQYFLPKPGMIVKTEQEIVDGGGRLFRMDRIVTDGSRVAVIDYKTGKKRDTHEPQLRTYMKLARQLFPGKDIEGILVYIDLKEVRRIF
ncbi:MAG: UvrD-helicase domain-containing protein [Nitrospirota bacterium]